DEVLALALRRFIRFVIEQRQAEHAVGDEHAFGETRIRLPGGLEAENALIEFARQPRIADRHGNMTNLGHGHFLRKHALAIIAPQRPRAQPDALAAPAKTRNTPAIRGPAEEAFGWRACRSLFRTIIRTSPTRS